jgi:hypothetical protein
MGCNLFLFGLFHLTICFQNRYFDSMNACFKAVFNRFNKKGSNPLDPTSFRHEGTKSRRFCAFSFSRLID